MKTDRVINRLAAFAVVGISFWFASEYIGRQKLAQEHLALLSRLEPMNALIAENEDLSNRVAQASRARSSHDDRLRELLRLRGEVGVLRQRSRELEDVRRENRQAHAGRGGGDQTTGIATADYWPKDSWSFAGYASPDAALKTSLWAADNGDVKALMAGATGEMRTMIESDLKGKSQDEIAVRMMDEVLSLQSVRVLNSEVQPDDSVVLTAAFEDRTDTHTTKFILKRVGDDWRLSGVVH